MTDLIRRADAIAACQVGPSDEWSRSTKSGYSQAATDCAMNVLRTPAAQLAVKPLEFVQREWCFCAADSIAGMYYITDYAGMINPFKLERPGRVGAMDFLALEAAKAAAQADYEARIRSALIDTPPAVSDDMAALVDASEIMAAALGALNAQAHRTMTGGYCHLIDDAAHALRDYRAALAKMKGGVK